MIKLWKIYISQLLQAVFKTMSSGRYMVSSGRSARSSAGAQTQWAGLRAHVRAKRRSQSGRGGGAAAADGWRAWAPSSASRC